MPKYFYLDPEIERTTPPDKFKAAQSNAESDTYKNGDIIEVWDHVFKWDDYCVPLKKAREWQHRGDVLADVALPILQGPAGDAGGTDLFMRLEAAATASDAPREVTAL